MHKSKKDDSIFKFQKYSMPCGKTLATSRQSFVLILKDRMGFKREVTHYIFIKYEFHCEKTSSTM